MSVNNTDAAYYTLSPICGGGNDFEGRLGLHIAALFVILITSTFGIPILTPYSFVVIVRCNVPSRFQKVPSSSYSEYRFHVRQVLLLRCHYRNRFHPSPCCVFLGTRRCLPIYFLGRPVSA
jgi:hypothetical protein